MTEHQIDSIIVDNVEHVRDRFGAQGLREMIALAEQELAAAEAALAELAPDDDR